MVHVILNYYSSGRLMERFLLEKKFEASHAFETAINDIFDAHSRYIANADEEIYKKK